MKALETVEIKFILKLLGFAGYRAKISDRKLKPNSGGADGTKMPEMRRIARDLAKAGYLETIEPITKVEATPAGLAAVQAESIPLPSEELAILKKCKKNKNKAVGRQDSTFKALGDQAESRLRRLAEQGLVKLTTELEEIALTTEGRRFLAHDFVPKSSSATITLALFANFTHFLHSQTDQISTPTSKPATESDVSLPTISDADGLLAVIEDLRLKAGEDELIPLYKIRGKVEPPLKREETDQFLYRLCREERIELIPIQNRGHHSDAEMAAAIAQDTGGPLFYVRFSTEEGL